jgi:hypothetical protein
MEPLKNIPPELKYPPDVPSYCFPLEQKKKKRKKGKKC